MSVETRAHVLTKEDGLRHVECLKNFDDEVELARFLVVDCLLIGAGKNALVFKLPELPGWPTESIIRVEMLNCISIEWSEQLMSVLQELRPEFGPKFEDIRVSLQKRLHDLSSQPKRLRRAAVAFLKTRIAAHNAAYRRNPGSCLPVNCFVSFQDRPVAILMKYLDGIELRNSRYAQDILPYEGVVSSDAENILVDICNVAPALSRHMIDISLFVPSNVEEVSYS